MCPVSSPILGGSRWPSSFSSQGLGIIPIGSLSALCLQVSLAVCGRSFSSCKDCTCKSTSSTVCPPEHAVKPRPLPQPGRKIQSSLPSVPWFFPCLRACRPPWFSSLEISREPGTSDEPSPAYLPLFFCSSVKVIGPVVRSVICALTVVFPESLQKQYNRLKKKKKGFTYSQHHSRIFYFLLLFIISVSKTLPCVLHIKMDTDPASRILIEIRLLKVNLAVIQKIWRFFLKRHQNSHIEETLQRVTFFLLSQSFSESMTFCHLAQKSSSMLHVCPKIHLGGLKLDFGK